MSDAKTAWMDGWLNAQQQYWKAWSDLASASAPAGKPAGAPWADALNQWWQTVSPLAPAPGRDLYNKLIEISKGYFTLAERMASSAQGADGDGLGVINSWIDGMQKALTDWTQGLGMHQDPQLKSFMTFWDLPMDTWQRLAANMVPMPGDFTQAFHPEGAKESLDQFNTHVSRFLAIPAVGYNRESQEQFQNLAQLALDYNTAMQAYKLAFGKVAIASLQDFQKSLQTLGQQDKKLGSIREVYDHWVDICEKVYARFVMSEEYQRLYGNLVNKLMSLKHQMARMVDQGLEAMNMPTRAEINTLQCRQQEIRRDNQRLRNELRALRKQMDGAAQNGAKNAASPATEASPAVQTVPVAAPEPAVEPVVAALSPEPAPQVVPPPKPAAKARAKAAPATSAAKPVSKTKKSTT